MALLIALLTFILKMFIISSAEDCTTGFSVVAPELAIPGKTTAVFVTLHGPTNLQPLNVTLRLRPDSPGTNRYDIETTQEIARHGILPLEIPSEAVGDYVLQTMINCTGNEPCELQSSSVIRLVGPVRDVIIRPAKYAYSPGETISFWILALDHDLQIAPGVIGSVSVKDAGGTKVAIWEQIPLHKGVRSFTLPLSEYVNPGKWYLTVEIESAEFFTPVEIDPNVGNGVPDVTAAEEHYVELRFAREMRRRYKPGLPFTGKVEAMSTEKSIRVRVKVYDNTTAIYSQDIEISNGEGTFIVPAILADSNIIALQAELVSVESKEIESHYVLAKEAIHKWNSSSDCYLLIEGAEHTLQPDEEAHVTILSTCPCERDLHYVITTDGRVTDWAQRRYEDLVPSVSATTGAVCRLTFSFTVRSVMAPVSQLLVYYITPQGEAVSDVITFDVKLLQKQVYVNLEEREWWLPGQNIDVDIVAEPSSLICLIGGRIGTSGDIRFDPRISEDRKPVTDSMEVDFLEAGVSFFQRQCVHKDTSGVTAISYRQRGTGAGPSSRRRPSESLVGGTPLNQLWLWNCFNYSSEDASIGRTISAPEEVGKWSLWALTVSKNGLRFSSPTTITVFSPLQVDFRLPPTLKVREVLEVDIKIGNHINSCMDVTALLALSEGAQFLNNGLLYVTERLRLGPQGATSLVVRLLVTNPGVKNLTVEVNGYTSFSCQEGEKSENTSLLGTALRSSAITVFPEGIVRTTTESAYCCANENLVISSDDKYSYEWVTAPRNHQAIIVELKAGSSQRKGPVYIAFAENRLLSDKSYRLTVGDLDNMITWIGRGKYEYSVQVAKVETPGILSQDTWGTFWITWDNDVLAFGNGSHVHNNTLLTWKMEKAVKINQIGFSSIWGSTAEFRIWNFNEEAGFSQVLHLDTPKSVVPSSEQGKLLVFGGLALPLNKKIEVGGLSDAVGSLISLLFFEHFDTKANETEKVDIKRHLPGIIQTILSYRKLDNSFSQHQMLSSHSTTLLILETLTKVQSYFSIDPELIQSVKRWVQLQQEDNGSFLLLPADKKFTALTQKQSDLNNLESNQIIETTAETIITLYEIGIENEPDLDTIQKAKKFLERNIKKIDLPETVAVVALALVLVKSSAGPFAIEKLRNISNIQDSEFGWPHMVPKKDAANWLFDSEAGKILKQPTTTTLPEYKASLYVLSAFCTIGDLKSAEAVAKYLLYRSHMLDKHPELLYLAVKAFTQYNLLTKDEHRALTISLATSGMELTDTLELKTDHLPQVLKLPSLPTKIFIYATGAGCATIQGKVSYSTYSVTRKTQLLELWSGITEEILPDQSSVEQIEGKLPMLKLKTCFKWTGAYPSGILQLEVTLFSGFELGNTPPQLLNLVDQMAEMQHYFYNNRLWFVFANVSTHTPVCVQYIARSAFIISALRPAYAKIYPSGRQDLAAETFFHAKSKSNLLKSVTEDDLITWFGSTRDDSLNGFFPLNTTETADATLAPMPPIMEISQMAPKANGSGLNPNKSFSETNNIPEHPVTSPEPQKTSKVSLPRHVNAIIHDLPERFARQDEVAGTLTPFIKNDQYILIDKEELWGMLKEVVDTQLNKANNLKLVKDEQVRS